MTLQRLQLDVPKEQERYHRNLLATTVNELIKTRPPGDRTEAEVSAGVTPVDYSYPPGDLRRYGAVGDGAADDTAAFEDCLLACSGAPYSMYVPAAPSKYKVDPLVIPSDIDIYVDGQAIIEANTGFSAADVLLDFSGADNVTMDCNGATFKMLKSEYTTGEQRHLFYLFGCTNVRLRNPHALDSGGDGYYINGVVGLTMENPISDNNRRQGMSVIGANNLRVTGVARFLNTTGTAPGDGLDFEPNSDQDELIDVTFETVYCENNDGNAVTFYFDDYKTGTPSNVSISIGKIISRGNTQALRVRNVYLNAGSYGGYISIGEVVTENDASNAVFVEDKSLSAPLLTVGKIAAVNPCTGSTSFSSTAAVYLSDTSATASGGIHIGQISAKATHTDMDYGVILEMGGGYTDVRIGIDNVRGFQVAPIRLNNITAAVAEASDVVMPIANLTATVALTSNTQILASVHLGRTITNTGAAGNLAHSLREYPTAGIPYRFRITAAHDLTIDVFDGADQIAGTTAPGAHIVCSTPGEECEVYYIGTVSGVRTWQVRILGNSANWTFT